MADFCTSPPSRQSKRSLPAASSDLLNKGPLLSNWLCWSPPTDSHRETLPEDRPLSSTVSKLTSVNTLLFNHSLSPPSHGPIRMCISPSARGSLSYIVFRSSIQVPLSSTYSSLKTRFSFRTWPSPARSNSSLLRKVYRRTSF